MPRTPLARRRFMMTMMLSALMAITALPGCYDQSDSAPPSDVDPRRANQVQISTAGAQMGGEGTAQQRLPEFRAAVEKKDSRYTKYFVCTRGATPEGHSYVTWYDGVRFENTQVKGKAFHPPVIASDITHGAPMSTSADQIIDWMMIDKSNKMVGGFTIKEQRSRMTPAERAKFDSYWTVKFE